jgi:hypothetical protein
VASDHSLWHWNVSLPGDHWLMLSPAGTISEEISATGKDGEVYAVASDHSLWQHTNSGWTMLSPAGTILSVSAGGVGVFAIAGDHSLWEFNAGQAGIGRFKSDGWSLLSPAGTILSISAGPHGEVFALASDHSLWHYGDETPFWRELSGPGTIESISAGSNGALAELAVLGIMRDDVFAVTSDHGLWRYKADGGRRESSANWEQLSPAGTMTEVISADSHGDVFAVPTAYESVWEHTSAGWTQLYIPGVPIGL